MQPRLRQTARSRPSPSRARPQAQNLLGLGDATQACNSPQLEHAYKIQISQQMRFDRLARGQRGNPRLHRRARPRIGGSGATTLGSDPRSRISRQPTGRRLPKACAVALRGAVSAGGGSDPGAAALRNDRCADRAAARWCDKAALPSRRGCVVFPTKNAQTVLAWRPGSELGASPEIVAILGRCDKRVYLLAPTTSPVLRKASVVPPG